MSRVNQGRKRKEKRKEKKNNLTHVINSLTSCAILRERTCRNDSSAIQESREQSSDKASRAT